MIFSEKLNILYKPTYNTGYKTDMSDVYTNLMNSPYMQSLNSTTPFKILFYNGDVSLKATTMEAEYFVESLASNLSAKVVIDRTNWLYKQPGAQGSTKTAGYRKEFLFKAQNVKVELATVVVCDFLVIDLSSHHGFREQEHLSLQIAQDQLCNYLPTSSIRLLMLN